MREKVLILGAGGTVGAAIYQRLSQSDDFDVYGTYFSSKPDKPHMRYFSLDNPEEINDILEDIAPKYCISALRGDFHKQIDFHVLAAEYLKSHQGRMIYFSTANVFDGALECAHYEEDKPQSVSEYGKFKICCEKQLRDILGSLAVIVRIPFVFGRNSVRMRQIMDGCKEGALDVYENLFSNYATDIQIADYIEWMIREKKEGIFHIGTTDVMRYSEFIKRLVKGLGEEYPVFHYLEAAGTMAVFTKRKDIPRRLDWDVERVIAFLCEKEQGK